MRTFKYGDRLILRGTPITLALLGWYRGRWVGLVAGIFVGLLLAFVMSIARRVVVSHRDLSKRKTAIAAMSNAELTRIATNPLALNMAFAVGELESRGIEAGPSFDSLRELLVSDNQSVRAHAMTMLFALYPDVFAKVAIGASSSDSAELWRERFAALDRGETGRGTEGAK